MKRVTVLSLAATIAGAGSYAFGDDAGSWYVDPMLQYHDTKSDPELKDNFGYQAGGGYNLPHGWAIEGDFSRGTFDIKGTDAERRLTGYSIDVIKKFFPDDIVKRWMVQPYALAGAGELDDRTSAPGYDSRTFHTWLAEAGVGFSEVSAHRASLEEAYMELTRDAVEFRAQPAADAQEEVR